VFVSNHNEEQSPQRLIMNGVALIELALIKRQYAVIFFGHNHSRVMLLHYRDISPYSDKNGVLHWYKILVAISCHRHSEPRFGSVYR